MGADANPPAYDSVFNQLAVKKAESNGIVDYTKGAADVYSKKASGFVAACLCGIFCSLLGIALPVTEIVIGSMYLHKCPAQRLLPIYLIVGGVFGLLTGGGGSAQRFSNRKDTEDLESDEENSGGAKNNAASGCSSLFGIFTFCWLICGTVWTFQMTECSTTDGLMINSTNVDCFVKDETLSDAPFYCRQLVYDFAYYELIVKWAIAAFMTFIGLMVCCCVCCAFCCMAGKNKQSSSELNVASNKGYSGA